MIETPQQLGYRMPAEWNRHETTWLAWPHTPQDWPGKFQPIPWAYAEVVRLLSAQECVHILVQDIRAQRRVKWILARAGANLSRVTFHTWPTDRIWTRDSGPIFVRNAQGQLGITNWHFNGWAKYPDWQFDDQLPGRVTELLGLPEWQPSVKLESDTDPDNPPHRLVLEGGSIDTNGEGILLTTEECLLSEQQQRNPGVSRAQLEQAFHDYPRHRSGHLARPRRYRRRHPRPRGRHHPLRRPRDHRHRRRAEHRAIPTTRRWPKILPASRPRARSTASSSRWSNCRCRARCVFSGQRLPASYANFYIANGLVLVPTFHDPNDRVALNMLAEVFPDREVIGIHCVDLVWGLGTLHCMTQQQPEALASGP